MNRPLNRGAARPFARPSKSPQQARHEWVAALDLAEQAARDATAMAEGADAAPSGQPGPVLTRLAVALRDLAPDNYPVQGFAPRLAASAFLALARGFVQPQGNAPEARTVLAPMLAQAATHLAALLNALRHTEAQAWRGQLGERED